MLSRLFEIDWDAPAMKAFDWSLALVSLGIGIWLSSWLWIAGGMIGAFLAWWRPMSRTRDAIIRAVVRRHTSRDVVR